MIGLYLKACLLLTCLFTMLLVGAWAIAPIDNRLESFIVALEDCAGSCLFGIQPGKTSVRDSLTLLRNHPWIGDVRQNASGNGYAQITWDWSGKQPYSIDNSQRGRITYYWDDEDEFGPTIFDSTIETISVYTQVRLYSFQQWLGETRHGNANNRPGGSLAYTVIYNVPDGMISVVTEMRCPVSIVSYWNAQARMTISFGHNDSSYVDPSTMVQMC